MMQTDIIVVGQGLCGTWLSYYLHKNKQTFIVIDEPRPNTASKIASGIINPVTGRRVVTTWMIEELMGFAWEAYTQIGKALNISCIEEKQIIDFFSTPQMRLAFIERFEKNTEYLSMPAFENNWLQQFDYSFGYGVIQPAYLVNLQILLAAQRNWLNEQHCFLEEGFDNSALQLHNGVVEYKNIKAKKIIFCDGVQGFENPFFKLLPFAHSKGEALLVESTMLPQEYIFKKGYSLVPWKENTWWLGSSYQWNFEHDLPTAAFYQQASNWLKQTLKTPYKIINHFAGCRPATLERRPFVGFHPLHSNVGILNGMGTKGCTLAPYFAHQLAAHITKNTALNPEADISRFTKILSHNH